MNRPFLSRLALTLGLVLVAAAIVAWVARAPGPVTGWLAAVGVVTLIGTIFERVRYKAVMPAPPSGPDWTATNERFRDPGTDRWVQVYYKADTGERRYVETAPPTS
ncbi:MAG TPA: hypothetical protein VG308_18935 [Stellaceae bacterium]|nr:hypothetical protein [Stellaceae bacterium]